MELRTNLLLEPNKELKAETFLQNWESTYQLFNSFGHRFKVKTRIGVLFGDLNRPFFISSVYATGSSRESLTAFGKGKKQTFWIGEIYFEDKGECRQVVNSISRNQSWEMFDSFRKAIHARDNNTCLYCGKTKFDCAEMCIDHVQADDQSIDRQMPDNLVTCCRACNSSKNNKTVIEFFKHVREKTGKQIVIDDWPDGPRDTVNVLAWESKYDDVWRD